MSTTASYQVTQEWVELFRMQPPDGNPLLFSFQDYYVHLSFGFQDTTGYYELDCSLDSAMQSKLGDGNVHHLIATYNPSSAYKAVWVDGAELCSTTGTPGTNGWDTGDSSTAGIFGTMTVGAFLIAC
jgi:hypothetical protein